MIGHLQLPGKIVEFQETAGKILQLPGSDFTLETATLGLESDVVLKLVTAEIRRAQGKA